MKDCERATRCEILKKIIHPALLKLMTVRQKGELNVSGNFPKKGNYLIVANHVCIDDIPTLGQALKRHFYLLVSDEDKKTIDGLALNLNGVEWVKRTDKEDRQRINRHLGEILKKGKTVAMYPESTWNLSPNYFIMPMNYGCIRLAKEANVSIIPVVSLFMRNRRYTVIGDEFIPNDNLEDAINQLQDIMSTMIYNEITRIYKESYLLSPHIFSKQVDGETYYYEKRSTIKPHYQENYVNELYDKYDRARKDKRGVREFESQFIFTPKDDAHRYFQEFNSIITTNQDGTIKNVSRISSEKGGYNGPSFGEETPKDSFGYGYNEHVLKKYLKR